MRETIGDIDILVASDDSGPFMEAFTGYPSSTEVIARGETKTSIRTRNGLQVDLRVVPLECLGRGAAVLHRLEGAQHPHPRDRGAPGAEAVRVRPVRGEDGELIVSETEEDVYDRLGLPWIPPTLREDRGEVEAALDGRAARAGDRAQRHPRRPAHPHRTSPTALATLEDDGRRAAAARGYAYYAVTDHAPEPVHAADDRREDAGPARAAARSCRTATAKMTLLHGTELNIDPDGRGRLGPASSSAGFDVCVASVHSHFNQAARRDDPAARPRLREPVREHHRPPHRPA